MNEIDPRSDPCGMPPFKNSHCEHGRRKPKGKRKTPLYVENDLKWC